MSTNNIWFHRGKYARLEGKDRAVNDGRVTPENRQQFYAGWDEQDRYLQPALTPEQEHDQDEALSMAREFLAANGFKSSTEEKP